MGGGANKPSGATPYVAPVAAPVAVKKVQTSKQGAYRGSNVLTGSGGVAAPASTTKATLGGV